MKPYRVLIYYREPTNRRCGAANERRYRALYEVLASCEDAAVELALAEFRRMQQLSGSLFSGLIDEVLCSPIDDPDEQRLWYSEYFDHRAHASARDVRTQRSWRNAEEQG